MRPICTKVYASEALITRRQYQSKDSRYCRVYKFLRERMGILLNNSTEASRNNQRLFPNPDAKINVSTYFAVKTTSIFFPHAACTFKQERQLLPDGPTPTYI